MEAHDPFWQTCIWLFAPPVLAAVVYLALVMVWEHFRHFRLFRQPPDDDDPTDPG